MRWTMYNTDMDNMEEITCAEAARRLGVSRDYIAKLAIRGAFTSRCAHGGRRLVRWADVLAWDSQPKDPSKGGAPRGKRA